MGNVETAVARFNRRNAAISKEADGMGDNGYAHKAGAYKELARQMAELADANARRTDDALPEPRSGAVRVKVELDLETLTVDGFYHAGEAASNDSAGADAEFEIDQIYLGPLDTGMLLEPRFDEIAAIALKAVESAHADAVIEKARRAA